MPSPNERKEFIKGGIYHIYNRGLNKGKIYHSNSDYQYFIDCLLMYLLPKDALLTYLSSQRYSQSRILSMVTRNLKLRNYSSDIQLHAFCLMPNHFHLLLTQRSSRGISSFLKSLQTRYAMYYSKKYGRIGPLFQSRYKGIPVKNDVYFNAVLNYIHNNPASLPGYLNSPNKYPWSSYTDYLAPPGRMWIRART